VFDRPVHGAVVTEDELKLVFGVVEAFEGVQTGVEEFAAIPVENYERHRRASRRARRRR